MRYRIFLIFILLIFKLESVDLIIYSYDRPLQLYALLESIDKYVTGLTSTSVIYRCSSDRFEKSYQMVQKKFNFVEFLKQGEQPKKDFKELTLKAFTEGKSEYILFAVDDIIVKDYIDLTVCVNAMRQDLQVYGFYLRLGIHLQYAYLPKDTMPVPPFKKLENNIIKWELKEGRHTWGYPHTVDMTLYRKKEIETDLYGMSYWNPNLLEGEWAGRSAKVQHRKALCFENSVIINIPLNRVQNTFHNPHMNFMTAYELLVFFEEGKKIDITPFHQMKNKSPHMNYIPTFIPL